MEVTYPSALRSRLKELTQPFHTSIENNPYAVKLANGSITHEEYNRFLHKMQAFVLPMEERFVGFEIEFEKIGVTLRERLRRYDLQNDIKALEMPKPGDIAAPDVPKLDSFARALGALYVMEGSTMGGKIIASRINQGLLGENPPMDYIYPYKENTMPMFQAMCKSIETFEHNGGNQEEAIIGACETYLKLEKWLHADESA